MGPGTALGRFAGMSRSEPVPLDAIWSELGNRFDPAVVERYRRLASDPDRAFAATRDDFGGDVAVLSTATHDINRSGAKRTLILGHLLLAIFDALRRGQRELAPLPAQRSDWASEETSLLLWAAQFGGSDIRESRVQETAPGGRL
jgi:hypothetical protein